MKKEEHIFEVNRLDAGWKRNPCYRKSEVSVMRIAIICCSSPIRALGLVLPLLLLSAAKSETASVDYRVLAVETLTAAAGRVDWSPDGEWIYYDRREDDYYYDVHRIRPDGTGDTCLTCDHPDLPNRHQGQPETCPGGRWLLFQAEKSVHWEGDWEYNPCKPGGGYYNDLYVMDLWSELPYDVHRLTDVRSGYPLPGGSLHPHFSHDGARLLWGDLEGTGGRFGDWRMAVADFRTDPFLRLENHRFYNPGDNPLWFETHGWGPDDSWIYFSAAPLPGEDGFAGDICRMDFSRPALAVRLTRTAGTGPEEGEWDEHAHLSPLNDAFVWMSSSGYGIHPEDSNWRGWLTSDLWLMNPDGSGPRQVTFFNQTGHDDYLPGEVVCADSSWSPDGSMLAVTLYHRGSGQTRIVIISFSHRSVTRSGDYDGDGTSDIGVFRGRAGLWAIREGPREYFGSAGDQPVPGDYDGDTTTDIGIFRSTTGLWGLRGVSRIYFGLFSDRPLPEDYDGDGRFDPAVFRPASGLWALRSLSRIYFGSSGDRPVPGDYNGDGTADIGIFRGNTGLWAVRSVTRLYFGRPDDVAVPGDYDGDGTWEVGIFRPTAGLWAIRGMTRSYFGGSGDVPVPADYDGDTFDDIGIFRSSSGLWAVRGGSRVYFGTLGDLPVTR